MSSRRAPSVIARSAAESEAPWAYDQLVQGRQYLSGESVDALRQSFGSLSGATGIGHSGRGLATGGESVPDVVEAQTVVTIVAGFTLSGAPTGNHGIISSLTSGNSGWALLADSSDFDSGDTDTFAWRSDVSGPQTSVTTGSGTATAGLHTLVLINDDRAGFNNRELWLDGALKGSKSTAIPPKTDGAGAWIGKSSNGSFLDTSDFPGQLHYVLVFHHRWSDGAIRELATDPFAPFRRRRLLVPVSSVGGATNASTTESAQGADAWSAVVSAPVTFVEIANATDTYAAVAMIGAALTEAVSAQDSDAGPATALGSVTEASTGNALVDAVAQISAAIVAGASAGESWVAKAQAVVDLVEAGAAGDTVTGAADSATNAAVSEGTQAGDALVNAVQAVASLTGASTAADALIAALVAIGSVTESAQAGATFVASTEAVTNLSISFAANASDSQSAVAVILAALTEAIDASALYTASATVAQSIAEAVQAGDTWSAVVPGTGYLVASAITITAALSGSVNIEPSLSGSVSIKPD